MIGRKILYALVIGLCGLIALLSLIGIIGGWALEKRAETAAVAALQVVQKSAGVVQQALIRVDQPLALLQSRTSEVADASQQLSQNVTDQGLVKVLLPEEQGSAAYGSRGLAARHVCRGPRHHQQRAGSLSGHRPPPVPELAPSE